MTTARPLPSQRSEFSVEDGVHYLNCAYFGPLPKSVEAAGIAGIRMKSSPAPFPSTNFFTDIDGLKTEFARLVGGEAHRVAVVGSVSYAVSAAADNVCAGPGQNIVIVEDQFPSNVYPWQRLAAERDLEIRVVGRPGPPPSRGLWNDRVLSAIDVATAVVALPQHHWTDGSLFDLVAAGRLARQVGAALIVDASQTVGAAPFSVSEVQPDMMVTVAYKWLMGPYSLGAAHFGPRFDDGRPLEAGWMGREGAEDFSRLAEYTSHYRPGAARYDAGETSNFITVPMMREALRRISEWDPASIELRLGELLTPLAEAAGELGWPCEDEAWRARHFLGLRLPDHVDPEAFDRALAAERVYLSRRGGSLRVSPGVFSEESDIGALIGVMRSVSSG